MAQSITTYEMQAILAQDDWLRRAAHRLFRDDHEAEDAAQETWTAELGQRQAIESRRPWSLRVLRNQRFALLRDRSRRRDFESDVAARGERFAPATDEVVGELQLREHATNALLRLEEPLRTTLYLRYVKDLSVGDVAESLDIAQSTASDRISRGLEKLRVELDQHYSDDRSAWRALLAPIAAGAGPLRSAGGRAAAGASGTAATTSVSTVIAWGVLAAMVLALGVAVTLRLRENAAASPVGQEPLAPIQANMAGMAPVQSTGTEVTPLPNAPAPSRAALLAGAVLQDGDDESEAQEEVQTGTDKPPELAHVTATVLLPDGRPALGAKWSVKAALTRIGGPDDRLEGVWEKGGYTGQVGADGSVEAAFPLPGPGQAKVVVLASLDGYVTGRRECRSPALGATEDLGKIRLELAGSLSGQLQDPEGNPLTGKDWRLRLMAPGVLNGLPIATSMSFRVNPKTGAYSLGGLVAGKVQLNYYVPKKGWQAGPVFSVVPGEIVTANIVQDGTFKDNQRRAIPEGLVHGEWRSLDGKPAPEMNDRKRPSKAKRTPKPSAPVDLTLRLAVPHGFLAVDPEEVIEAAFMGEEYGTASHLKGKGSVLGPGTINANDGKELWIRGDDWMARYPGEALEPIDGKTPSFELSLDLKLTERRVRFTLEGKPLSKRRLDLQVLPMKFSMRPRGGSLQTDAEGWATVRLGELPKGETYRFSINSMDPAEFTKLLEAPWPLPDGDEVGGPLTLEFK